MHSTKTEINQRTKIGTLSAQINESAYAIKPDQIESIVTSNNESEIQIEIVPTDTYPGNTASKYDIFVKPHNCLLYTSPSPRVATLSRVPASA